MAIWDFRPRGDVLTGVAVGVAAIAAPVVMPLAWAAVRPWLKAVLRGGVMLYDAGREAFAEAGYRPDGRKLKKATQSDAKAATQPAKKTDRESGAAPVTEDTEKLTGAAKRDKPVAKKPRRQTTKKTKKSEKKV